MKKLIFIMTIFLMACGQERSKQDFTLSFNGAAAIFKQGDDLKLGGSRVVDSSVINMGNHLEVYYDYADGTKLNTVQIDSKGETNLKALPAGINFTYTLYHNNVYYMFGQKNWNIYLFTSSNGSNWSIANNAKPVLTRSSDKNSNWFFLWNVGVDIDDNGTWHMFVECSNQSPNQTHVGLCYTTSLDPNDFDSGKTSKFITGGGNPYVKFLSGRGLLIVHGQIWTAQDQFTSNYWYVTASTMDLNGNIITHQDKFSLGMPGVHICDPHIVEDLSGGLMLVVSVDQSHVGTAYANTTFEALFDALF